MKNIVIISANPKTKDQSISLQLAMYTKQKLETKYPNANIIEHNLYEDLILDLNSNILSGNIGLEEQEIFSKRQKHLDEFMKADLVVISTPMWNHNYPAQIKLYLDCLWVAKTTFAYDMHGEVNGLLTSGSKKIMLIATMGGLNFNKGNDYGYPYVKDTFLTIGLGLNDLKYIPVQGSAYVPQNGYSESIGFEKALASGKKQIDFALTSYK